MADFDDTDELERTRWEKIRGRPSRSRSRSSYEGDDRREATSPNLIAYLPLALACLAGVAGYVQMGADVATLKRDVSNAEQAFRTWNVSISERVRELERAK